MKLAFVYSGGRAQRGLDGPSDFFYGARELAEQAGWEIECVDLDGSPADPGTAIFGRLLGKCLPPRTSADWIARCRRALPRLREADMVVATATEISFGLAVWKALGFFRKPLVGILCGAVNYPIGSELRRKGVTTLLGKFRPVLFADAELAELERRFDLQSGFSSVGWFGVDENFWNLPERYVDRAGVLAVGNDSRRDFETLAGAAWLLPGIHFTVITRRKKPANLPENVEWRRGDWKAAPISDEELRDLYQGAACVVVPLEECIQPSGQSVAMQAMMCGAPVVHTRTVGWWGANVVRDGSEVCLVPPKNVQRLADAIRKTSSSASRTVARDALLREEWTCAGFAKRLENIMSDRNFFEDR